MRRYQAPTVVAGVALSEEEIQQRKLDTKSTINKIIQLNPNIKLNAPFDNFLLSEAKPEEIIEQLILPEGFYYSRKEGGTITNKDNTPTKYYISIEIWQEIEI